VLFGLEELDTFADETETMWRAFVASVIASVALQYVSPFGDAKLVLFQVKATSDAWRAFELVPWLALGVIGVSDRRFCTTSDSFLIILSALIHRDFSGHC
jgi:chloride channel 3/4/5